MWRLTVYQKKITTYLVEGKEKSFDSDETISFESESMEALLLVVAKLSTLETEMDTRFEIVKVKESEK